MPSQGCQRVLVFGRFPILENCRCDGARRAGGFVKIFFNLHTSASPLRKTRPLTYGAQWNLHCSNALRRFSGKMENRALLFPSEVGGHRSSRLDVSC